MKPQWLAGVNRNAFALPSNLLPEVQSNRFEKVSPSSFKGGFLFPMINAMRPTAQVVFAGSPLPPQVVCIPTSQNSIMLKYRYTKTSILINFQWMFSIDCTIRFFAL